MISPQKRFICCQSEIPRLLPSQDEVLQLNLIGMNVENRNLIEPNCTWIMIGWFPTKLLIFCVNQKSKTVTSAGHVFCWTFFFKKVLKILLPKTSEPLKANMDWMFTAWFLITIVTLYYTKIKFVTDILYV
jgi:hypothetical protein